MKKLDLENHFYNDYSVEVLQGRSGKGYPYWDEASNAVWFMEQVSMDHTVLGPKLMDFAEKRIPEMEKLDIVKAVISLAPGIDILPAEESVDACRQANDALYELTQRYPRLVGSAILPMFDADAAVKELERCVKDLGFVMWQAHSNIAGRHHDEEQFRPIWKKVEELGIFAYLHPNYNPLNDMFNDYGYPMAGPGLGFTADTSGAIIRIMLSGMLDEMPELKIVLGHYGEALPFLMERLDNRMAMLPEPKQHNDEKPSYYFGRNIMVTTSGNTSIPAFECTRAAIGMDSIFLGTDYPFESMTECIEYLERCPMSHLDREKLYYKNAVDRLGISL